MMFYNNTGRHFFQRHKPIEFGHPPSFCAFKTFIKRNINRIRKIQVNGVKETQVLNTDTYIKKTPFLLPVGCLKRKRSGSEEGSTGADRCAALQLNLWCFTDVHCWVRKVGDQVPIWR